MRFPLQGSGNTCVRSFAGGLRCVLYRSGATSWWLPDSAAPGSEPAASSGTGGFWIVTAPNGSRTLQRCDDGPSGAVVAETELPSVPVFVQSGSEDVATRLERCPVPDPGAVKAVRAAARARDAIAKLPKPRFGKARNARALQEREISIELQRAQLDVRMRGGVATGAAADEDGTPVGVVGALVLPDAKSAGAQSRVTPTAAGVAESRETADAAGAGAASGATAATMATEGGTRAVANELQSRALRLGWVLAPGSGGTATGQLGRVVAWGVGDRGGLSGCAFGCGTVVARYPTREEVITGAADAGKKGTHGRAKKGVDEDGLADEDEDEEEARLGIEAARVRWRTLWTRAPPGMGAPGSPASASRPMLPDGTAGLCVETDEEAARVALIASSCEATGARIPPDVAVAAGGPRRTVRVVTTPFLDRICCDWSGSRVANRSWAARVMWATGGVLEGGDDGIWVVRPPGRGCGADARVVGGVANGTESTAEHAPTTDEPSAAASRRSAGTVAFDMLGWVPVASDAGTSSTDV